jgi:hypothetical protein
MHGGLSQRLDVSGGKPLLNSARMVFFVFSPPDA